MEDEWVAFDILRARMQYGFKPIKWDEYGPWKDMKLEQLQQTLKVLRLTHLQRDKLMTGLHVLKIYPAKIVLQKSYLG